MQPGFERESLRLILKAAKNIIKIY